MSAQSSLLTRNVSDHCFIKEVGGVESKMVGRTGILCKSGPERRIGSRYEGGVDFVEDVDKEQRWVRQSKVRCLWIGVRENLRWVTLEGEICKLRKVTDEANCKRRTLKEESVNDGSEAETR